MKSAYFWAIVVCCAACKHGEEPREQAKPAASLAPTAQPSSQALVPSPSASASAAAPSKPLPAEIQLLMKWNAALDRHAADDLSALYAEQVLFYGQRYSREKVVEAKRKALTSAPDFRQRVANVSVEKDKSGIAVRFEKHSGKNAESVVGGRLLLASAGGRLVIAEESDTATDQRFKPQPEPKTCGEVAYTAISKQPEVAAELARVARELPHFSPGGLENEAGPDKLSGSYGFFNEDHYDPRWWIEAGSGKLSIRNAYTGDELPIAEPERLAAQKLCNGKLESADE